MHGRPNAGTSLGRLVRALPLVLAPVLVAGVATGGLGADDVVPDGVGGDGGASDPGEAGDAGNASGTGERPSVEPEAGDGVGAVGELDGIEGFGPNYLLAGADSIGPEDGTADGADCDVKFQLSFARRLSAPRGMRDGALGRTFGRRSPLFFAFTQRAWWDVCRESLPFRETNYEPSLFLKGAATVRGAELDLLAGYVHQSNGEGGEGSTGWDRLFARVRLPLGERADVMGFETTDRRRWLIDLTLWYPIAVSDGNEDIARFAGYGELVLTYTPTGETRLRLAARKGGGLTRFERGLGELDVVFPLPGTDVQGMLQYTNGYGASLGRFDEHEYALRVGVLFSDVTLP